MMVSSECKKVSFSSGFWLDLEVKRSSWEEFSTRLTTMVAYGQIVIYEAQKHLPGYNVCTTRTRNLLRLLSTLILSLLVSAERRFDVRSELCEESGDLAARLAFRPDVALSVQVTILTARISGTRE
jgi:hypothetical protein